MKRFEYFEPHSLKEVLDLLNKYQGEAKVLAGGTDIMIKIKKRILSPPFVVNLKRAKGLNDIHLEGKGVRIGALTVIHTLQKSHLIAESFQILAQAAASIGSKQIRNMATVGGNLCLDSRCHYYDHSQYWLKSWEKCLKRGGEICHVRKGGGCEAIISGDLACPLMALKADLRISSLRGERVIPLEEFLTGGKVPNILKEDEIIKDVLIPLPTDGTGTAFVKYAKRAAVDFSLISVAAVMSRSSSDRSCTEARVVVGQVSSAPIRASAIELFLLGKHLDLQTLREASRLVSREEMKVSNADGFASYKHDILETLIQRALIEAWDRTDSLSR